MDALLMRPTEVAAALGVGRATAYGLIASGTLPIVRIGRAVRVPRAALEAWVRKQAQQAATDKDADLLHGGR